MHATACASRPEDNLEYWSSTCHSMRSLFMLCSSICLCYYTLLLHGFGGFDLRSQAVMASTLPTEPFPQSSANSIFLFILGSLLLTHPPLQRQTSSEAVLIRVLGAGFINDERGIQTGQCRGNLGHVLEVLKSNSLLSFLSQKNASL